MFRLLAIGDVTTPDAVDYLARTLFGYRRENRVDFVVVNGENASFLGGISPEAAQRLLDGGADCITGGNHTMQTRTIYTMLDDSRAVLRPLNYPDAVPGTGYTVLTARGVRVLVLSALGCVYMQPDLDDPLPRIERILEREAGNYDLSVLDFHAEATGEKLTAAYRLDGRISAVFGTHTHVPTADGRILPHGTGYISDLGMCGHAGGVLGVDPDVMIERFRTHLFKPYSPASGAIYADGVLFDLDETTGKTVAVSRVIL